MWQQSAFLALSICLWLSWCQSQDASCALTLSLWINCSICGIDWCWYWGWNSTTTAAFRMSLIIGAVEIFSFCYALISKVLQDKKEEKQRVGCTYVVACYSPGRLEHWARVSASISLSRLFSEHWRTVFPSPFISTSFFSFMFMSVSLLSAYANCAVTNTAVNIVAANTAVVIAILFCFIDLDLWFVNISWLGRLRSIFFLREMWYIYQE